MFSWDGLNVVTVKVKRKRSSSAGISIRNLLRNYTVVSVLNGNLADHLN